MTIHQPIIVPATGFVSGVLPVDEDDVVLFAGGGGSSIAIEEALGKSPDAALNHWPLACSVHMVNFPHAETHCADVMETDCRIVLPGRAIRLLWLSPDCRHFSPAKGAAPVSESIRALAWAAIPWAKLRRPRVIVLENVEAFLTWGPVIARADGRLIPDPARKGQTFARWKSRLEALGYVVEWKILSAADYGAPTIRKRLFLVARCDGRPIAWPAPTHAPRAVAKAKGLKAHRAAAEIIDWSRPCPSIFLSKDEARALRVKRPLEEATLRRIAKGLFRYTIAHADPFIVPVTHWGDDRVHDIREPLKTITAGPKRGEFAIVAPVMVGTAFGDERERAGLRAWDVEDPLRGVAGSNDKAVAAAFLTKFSENSTGHLPSEPLHTVMAGAPRHGLVTAFLGRQFGASVGSSADEPCGTITAGGGGKTQCVASYMEQANTDMVGHDARAPVSTIVGKGCTQRLITAQLSQLRGSNEGRGELDEALPSPTAGGQHAALLEATLQAEHDLAVPFGREAQLRAFLVKYYGAATGQDLAAPLDTVTSRSRFGLVIVKGVAWRIVDIGMRMLDPETELAAAMGVPRRYQLGFDANGVRVTKTAVTKMVGNMVSPPPAVAVLRANFPELAITERVAA